MYRLFGAETSAYSTKMRAYLRYKGVEFEWMPRTQETEEELKRVSRFATLPVLVTASGFAVHDTTPMMEALEADSPEPSAIPADPALAFLACVLEEYADSWLAKAAFHYRWTRKKDQRLAAQRAVEDYYTQEPPADRKGAEDAAIVRMLDQMRVMQLEGELGAAVEKSFKRFVKLLDDHLRKHLCLFGERPSIADFAIAAQMAQMMKDPTPAKIIEKDGEFVAKWVEFLADPKANGPYAALEDLTETLAPIFASDLATGFLPWAAENLESSLAGAETFTVTLGKDEVKLTPLRSAARSFRELRRKFVTGQQIEALKAFTDATETTVFLLRPQQAERARAPQEQPSVDVPAAEADASADGAPAVAGEATGEDQAGDGGRRRRRRRRGGRDRQAAGADETGADDTGADAEEGENSSEDVSAEAAEGEAAEDTAAQDAISVEADHAGADAGESAAGSEADDGGHRED